MRSKKWVFILAGLATAFLILVFVRLIGSSGVFERGTLHVSFSASPLPDDLPTDSIRFTLSEIELWDQNRGWRSVWNDEYEFIYDGSAVQDQWRSAVTTRVPPGEYDRLRLSFADIKGERFDEVFELSYLDTAIAFDVPSSIDVDGDSSIHFTLQSEQSFRTMADGSLVFLPSFHVESRHGVTVEISDDDLLTVSGGVLDTNQTYGIESNGHMKANYRLPESSRIEKQNGELFITDDHILTPVERLEQEEMKSAQETPLEEISTDEEAGDTEEE